MVVHLCVYNSVIRRRWCWVNQIIRVAFAHHILWVPRHINIYIFFISALAHCCFPSSWLLLRLLRFPFSDRVAGGVARETPHLYISYVRNTKKKNKNEFIYTYFLSVPVSGFFYNNDTRSTLFAAPFPLPLIYTPKLIPHPLNSMPSSCRSLS